MKMNAHSSSITEAITVIDRRDAFRIKRTTLRVEIVKKTDSSFVFGSDWRFPVPASKRRYFIGALEIAIEELGKMPRRNTFLFSAAIITKQKNARRN
jgi:hypothetical protein